MTVLSETELFRPPPVVEEMDFRMVDDIFVKYTSSKRGNFLVQHVHEYDHLTMIATGMVRLWVDDVIVGDFQAPAPIEIKAGKKHQFFALTDCTIYCIHRMHENEPDKERTKEGIAILRRAA